MRHRSSAKPLKRRGTKEAEDVRPIRVHRRQSAVRCERQFCCNISYRNNTPSSGDRISISTSLKENALHRHGRGNILGIFSTQPQSQCSFGIGRDDKSRDMRSCEPGRGPCDCDQQIPGKRRPQHDFLLDFVHCFRL